MGLSGERGATDRGSWEAFGGAGPALVVIDMLNSYQHEDGEVLARSVGRCVGVMQRLIARARSQEALVVYVNDNYGDWSAGRDELLERALEGAHPSLVEPLAPPPDVPFLTKARHSAFYETQLEYLLRHERIERVVLIGQVTEQCILYSALDAYVRHFSITVPRDGVAHIREDLAEAALQMMQVNMAAEVLTAEPSSPADTRA
jgi:nicotinamidase-related amidase